MLTVTFSEARQKLSSIPDKAKVDGKVIIIRKDGSEFELPPIESNDSPLNVVGVDLNIETDELLDILAESRER